jgi:DNA helicase-2/ATP-dependent DNA helicase PcrA
MATVRRYIIGPPGCGKTSKAKAYVEQITDVNRPKRVMPAEVALVSFTNAAAATLAGRGIPVPRQNIGTLHSFAFKALGLKKEQVAESKIEDFNKSQSVYNLVETKSAPSPEYDAPGDGAVGDDGTADELLNRYNILRAKMVPKTNWRTDVTAFADRWESWKTANDLYDFSDMIELSLLDVDKMPNNPAVIIADEAQDFAPLELSLLKKWSEPAEIVNYIGDPDQILYTFKGVDPNAFKNLTDNSFRQVLSQSYRVPEAVHKLAVKWVGQIRDREPVDYFPTAEPGRVARVATNFKEPERLIKIIEKAASDGRDVMVMASCAFMVDPIIKLLRNAGIPFWNPNRTTNGRWNPLESGGNTASSRILAFLRPDAEVWQDQARFWTAGDLQKWSEFIESDGNFIRGAKKAIKNLAPETNLSIAHLLNYMPEETLSEAINNNLNWFRGALIPSKFSSFDFPFTVADKHGARRFLEPRRVKVGTIHSFKGDEADLCILFPDLSTRGMVEWTNGGAGRASVIRQFYVAITRARSELLIADPATNLAVKI